MRKKFLFGFIFCILISLCIGAGSLLENSFAVLKQANVVAFSKWMVQRKEYICIVSETKLNGLPFRVLTIYKSGDSKFESPVFKLKVDDGFIGMWPTKDDGGDLITIWEGPTAYHVEIIGWINGSVKQMLSAGASFPPEIVRLSGIDEKPCVLLTDAIGAEKNTQWRTSIYRWNGKVYKLDRTVQYLSRFSLVK